MSTLNESHVEDAALTWFGELGYAIGHGPNMAPGKYAGGTLTPALSHGERESYSEVAQSLVAQTLIPAFSHEEKEKREAFRRLNPAATVKESLSVQTKEPQP